MIAAPARPGKWLDTSVICSTDVLTAAAAQGYGGIVRYVPLPRNSGAWDITELELDRIVAADLQCALVQHVRKGHWNPSLCSGSEDADAAVDWAIHAGYPAGCHIFCDAEDMAGIDLSAIHYLNEWSAEVIQGGFLAGLYVGFSVPLTPEQLWELPGFNQYWSDAGKRHVATRGCSMVQGGEVQVQGTTFDIDYVAPDLLGGLPMVATSDEAAS